VSNPTRQKYHRHNYLKCQEVLLFCVYSECSLTPDSVATNYTLWRINSSKIWLTVVEEKLIGVSTETIVFIFRTENWNKFLPNYTVSYSRRHSEFCMATTGRTWKYFVTHFLEQYFRLSGWYAATYIVQGCVSAAQVQMGTVKQT
jgi:hypothetical protein